MEVYKKETKKTFMRLYSIAYFTSLLSMISFNGMCQSLETFTDIRDGQEYRMRTINGTTWMLDNLNYRTELSVEPPEEEKGKYQLTGRYYHLLEIDTICPSGWRLPLPEEWLRYYEHLTNIDSLGISVEFTIEEEAFIYSTRDFDISAGENLLDLQHSGWWEGDNYGIFPVFMSTYWTADPPTYETMKNWKYNNKGHVHIMPKVYEGKTHIHIGREGQKTTIHSHDHHLKAGQEKRLRRFLIRCVKIE